MSAYPLTLSAPPGTSQRHPVIGPPNGYVLEGKYRIEGRIGEGGMGLVYAATQIELGRKVAVKIMSAEAPSALASARFLREARAAALLKSEHVARVFDLGTTVEGRPFIVMELLEGVDLDDHLAKTGPLPLPFVVEVLLQTCQALEEAHGQGIIHRDLKPSNVFLVESGGRPSAKLLDFGVSKFVGGSGHQTSAHGPVGTPAFMSPEQLRGEEVGVAGDVWSLGVMLYELLTARPLFDANTFAELSVQILTAPRPFRLTPLRPDLPAELDGVLARCLAVAPTDRYGSVSELAFELSRICPVEARSPDEWIAHTRPDLVLGAQRRAEASISWTKSHGGRAREYKPLAAVAFVVAVGLGGLLAFSLRGTDASATVNAAGGPNAAAVAPEATEAVPARSSAPAATASPSVTPQPAATATSATKPASQPTAAKPSRPTAAPRPATKPRPAKDEFGGRR